MFQSTPPAWGATSIGLKVGPIIDVSIHAPRVGGDRQFHLSYRASSVSIHAPRVGGDGIHRDSRAETGLVSIHAPRVGGDTAAREP